MDVISREIQKLSYFDDIKAIDPFQEPKAKILGLCIVANN